MSSIQLTFINESNDQNNSSIVIFQKNENDNKNDYANAWHVIQNIGIGWTHDIEFPIDVQIVARDSWKNYTPRINAKPGESFEVVNDISGDVLKQSADSTTSPTNILFRNKLASEVMDALIYRNGKLLAEINDIGPGNSADFKFEPSIYIGVATGINEGDKINSDIVNSIATKISLKGIESGKIIMTGGGTGPNAKPFSFELVADI